MAWSNPLKVYSWDNKIVRIFQRRCYIDKTIENGWSRNILTIKIETNLYARRVLADKITNFKSLMPAAETLKDPYIFDFIVLKEGLDERDIEEQGVNLYTFHLDF